MTFSVVAYCERTGQIGIAVATAMHASGKLAIHAKANAGAVATQANLNPYLGYDGLRLLARSQSAQATLDRLLARDPDPRIRQVGIVDRGGHTAVWSGEEIFDWAGSRTGHHFAALGNRLVGPEVLDAMTESMTANTGRDLCERLLVALEAGVAAGGDREGERSANIEVMANEEYPLWDIRVDDHDRPVAEVRRLFHLFQDALVPQVLRMPTRRDFPPLEDD